MTYIIGKILDSFIGLAIDKIFTFITNKESIRTRFDTWRINDKKVRMSLSYLFQIKDNGKFLMIQGNRIQQYQPVGGVYKYYDTFNDIKQELEISDESNQYFFEDKDLRFELPGKNVIKVLDWFKTQKNRETTVSREFIEEIIESGILDMEDLKEVQFEYVNTKETGLQYSEYFKIDEFLSYDIFRVTLSDKAMEKLRKNVACNSKFLWVSQNDINRKNIYINGQAVKIGEHAKYITTC